MNLLRSVERFAFDDVTDPYGVGSPMKGRLSVFDDEKSSGVSTRRRVLETLPSYVMYPTMCVTHNGVIYIVGEGNYDRHRDVTIRIKYPVIPCDTASYIASVEEILSNTVTTTPTYAFYDPSRNAVADSETTFPVSIFSVLMPAYENISVRDILVYDGKYFRVRSVGFIDGAGFQVVEANLVEDPLQSMTFEQKSGYDPITESMVTGASYPSTVTFVESIYYNYIHKNERFVDVQPGDKVITSVLAVVPKSGDMFDDFKVLSVSTVGTSTYACHCRL